MTDTRLFHVKQSESAEIPRWLTDARPTRSQRWRRVPARAASPSSAPPDLPSSCVLRELAGDVPPPGTAACVGLRDAEPARRSTRPSCCSSRPRRASPARTSVEFHLHGGRAVIAALLPAVTALDGVRLGEARRVHPPGRRERQARPHPRRGDRRPDRRRRRRRSAGRRCDKPRRSLEQAAEGWRRMPCSSRWLSPRLRSTFPDEEDVPALLGRSAGVAACVGARSPRRSPERTAASASPGWRSVRARRPDQCRQVDASQCAGAARCRHRLDLSRVRRATRSRFRPSSTAFPSRSSTLLACAKPSTPSRLPASSARMPVRGRLTS